MQMRYIIFYTAGECKQKQRSDCNVCDSFAGRRQQQHHYFYSFRTVWKAKMQRKQLFNAK